jgi:hypothetical protein
MKQAQPSTRKQKLRAKKARQQARREEKEQLRAQFNQLAAEAHRDLARNRRLIEATREGTPSGSQESHSKPLPRG